MLPQPVLIIGTYNADGTPNAMNAAWGGQWDQHEIMISMGAHATTANLDRCGDFTLAFATEPTLVAADYVGLVSARNHPEKMESTGWKATLAPHVNAPLFDCFPMTMECRIKEKLYPSETGYYIVAEIIAIHCLEEYLAADGQPDVERMGLITYDPVHHGYLTLGTRAGAAFSAGKALATKE